MASSLDCPGYFTRTVRDAGWLYEVTAGHDPRDATSLREAVSLDPNLWSRTHLEGIRIGVPKEYLGEGIDAEVKSVIEATIEMARENGAKIVDISLPHTKEAISVYYIITPAEVASNLARYDGIRFGEKAEGIHDIRENRSEFL